MSEHQFDELARRVAASSSRREALRILGKGAIASVSLWLGSGFLRTAKAQGCGTVDSDGGCPGFGIKRRKSGYVPTSNGCGGAGITEHIVPNSYFNANFKPACDAHDICYTDCNKTKERCDDEFYDDLMDACRKAYPSWWEVGALASCEAVVHGYYQSVRTFGHGFWVAAQQEGCECCPT